MPSQNIVVMGQKDGIFNEVFQQNAMELLKDGRIVAGTTDDFVYFNPKSFKSSSAPPPVSITSFKVFDQKINFDSITSQGKKIWLPFNQNFIKIEYSPLGFLNDNLSYYYKLEGLDKNWIRGTNELSANYANLGAGSYTFLVKSENGDGVSSRQVTALEFVIRPPFWESWWFLFLLASGVAFVLYFLHRLRVNRIIAMEKVRSRIARDLHDDMGSTLSTINILSEMAKMKIEKDTTTTKGYINKISDNSSRMMEAMDDIVWSINPMNDNMQRITARMREYATNLLEAKDIEYTFQVDEAVKHVKLDMEARRDFFLIFKEAINNLAKYSDCTYAQIKIEVYEYTMMMKIQDNGKGFIVKDADSGNGLTNMQKRAQSLNSKIHIESHPGMGTKILLEVNFA
jgi:two-component sensor histidine kinase